MAESIPCRKVYKLRMEPTEMEALELKRTASVARYIYNWGLARCRQHYQQRVVAEGHPETENACGLRVSLAQASVAG